MTDSPTATNDSIGNPIHTDAAAGDASLPDHLRDSVGGHVGIEEREQPISVNAIARIRELLDVLPATDAAIVGQIKALLPSLV